MMTLNHGLSGYVCGRVAMPVLRRWSPLSARALGWAFFLGAMMPDADVVTRIVAGRGDYFGRSWYSHRQITHSILGTLLCALIAGAVLFAPVWWRSATPRRAFGWAAGCLWAGGLLHLFGDMVTPSRPLPLFWPLEGAWGGWSLIGWYSPYLSVLFLAAIAAATVVSGAARVVLPVPWRAWAAAAAWLIYTAAGARWFHYMAVSRYVSSDQWAQYQRSLLPEPLVAMATEGVATLWSLIAH